MATARVSKVSERDERIPPGKKLIGYQEAVESLTADEAFRATVYAMNTLLMQKGYYSAEEFQFQFRQSAQKQLGGGASAIPARRLPGLPRLL